MRDYITLIGTLLLLALLAHMSGRIAEAQKAERGTQQWNIDIDRFNAIRVIDTSGVCLYVVYTNSNSGVSVAAVPKTQLPPNTGCQ